MKIMGSDKYVKKLLGLYDGSGVSDDFFDELLFGFYDSDDSDEDDSDEDDSDEGDSDEDDSDDDCSEGSMQAGCIALCAHLIIAITSPFYRMMLTKSQQYQQQ